jgi:hypothetical protein
MMSQPARVSTTTADATMAKETSPDRSGFDDKKGGYLSGSKPVSHLAGSVSPFTFVR